jgi:hypothetical protein
MAIMIAVTTGAAMGAAPAVAKARTGPVSVPLSTTGGPS